MTSIQECAKEKCKEIHCEIMGNSTPFPDGLDKVCTHVCVSTESWEAVVGCNSPMKRRRSQAVNSTVSLSTGTSHGEEDEGGWRTERELLDVFQKQSPRPAWGFLPATLPALPTLSTSKEPRPSCCLPRAASFLPSSGKHRS
jgi:hypothetical protein